MINDIFLGKKIGDKLKAISKERSQKEIASSIDVSKSRITKIIQGESRYLSYFQLYKLNEDFNIDLNELITGEPYKNKEMTQNNIGDNNTNNMQVIESQSNEIEALKKTIEVQEKYIKSLEKQLNID